MMPKRKVVVFDLDDTLYKEVDYLKSAYREIATFLETNYGLSDVYDRLLEYWQNGVNAFDAIISESHLPLRLEELIKMYREHRPHISLEEETRCILDSLHKECVLGIITDGRSLTQRNKIEALGLCAYIPEKNISISEETGFPKPYSEPFASFMQAYPDSDYYYIGDNPSKDFVAPNQMDWTTVCLLDDGRNVHPQVWSAKIEYLPQKKVKSILELLSIL